MLLTFQVAILMANSPGGMGGYEAAACSCQRGLWRPRQLTATGAEVKRGWDTGQVVAQRFREAEAELVVVVLRGTGVAKACGTHGVPGAPELEVAVEAGGVGGGSEPPELAVDERDGVQRETLQRLATGEQAGEAVRRVAHAARQAVEGAGIERGEQRSDGCKNEGVGVERKHPGFRIERGDVVEPGVEGAGLVEGAAGGEGLRQENRGVELFGEVAGAPVVCAGEDGDGVECAAIGGEGDGEKVVVVQARDDGVQAHGFCSRSMRRRQELLREAVRRW